MSYSEEYGLSFGVSHSTSTEDGQLLYVSRNSSFNTAAGREGTDGKLHRLMGYSSASELLRRYSPDLFESFDGRTPTPTGRAKASGWRKKATPTRRRGTVGRRSRPRSGAAACRSRGF